MSSKKKHNSKHEVRISAQPSGQRFEIRTDPKTGARSIEGYYATFGTVSKDLGFREVLQQGCFAESLRTQPVRAFVDHDPTRMIGNTASGTLQVREDSKGLAFNVQLPSTSYANDLVELLERGDAIGECSFGFSVAPGGEQWSELPNGEILRTITRAVLYEGSVLTGNEAAYPGTQASLRNMPEALKEKLTKRGVFESIDVDDDIDCDDPDNEDAEECQDSDEDRSERCECRCGLRDCASLIDDETAAARALLLARLK